MATVGSELGEIAATVLLPLQKGLKMKPIAKLVICNLAVFAYISECGCEREEAPVLAHHLVSVSSSTLRSESFICMDALVIVCFVLVFVTRACSQEWLVSGVPLCD